MSNTKRLAGEMNDDDVAVLNDQQYADATEVMTSLNEEDKAGIEVEALLNMVEQDAGELETFVDILMKKPHKFNALGLITRLAVIPGTKRLAVLNALSNRVEQDAGVLKTFVDILKKPQILLGLFIKLSTCKCTKCMNIGMIVIILYFSSHR